MIVIGAEGRRENSEGAGSSMSVIDESVLAYLDQSMSGVLRRLRRAVVASTWSARPLARYLARGLSAVAGYGASAMVLAPGDDS
jgi:hypothetical protein